MCLDCKVSKITFDPVSIMTVQSKPGSLQQAVNDYILSEEIITDFKCSDKCTRKECKRTVEFSTYPKVLKIVINR